MKKVIMLSGLFVLLGSALVEAADLEPGVIYEDAGIRISYNGCELSGDNPTINFLVENETQDSYSCIPNSVAVNGAVVEQDFYFSNGFDIAAGKKAIANIEADPKVIQQFGIGSVQSVDIDFLFFTEDHEEIDTGAAHYGEDYPEYDMGTVISDGDDLTVGFVGRDGEEVTYAIKSNLDNYATIHIEDVTVNDFTIDSSTRYMVSLPNCINLANVYISDDDLSSIGAQEVETLEFSVNIRPENSLIDARNTELMGGTIN